MEVCLMGQDLQGYQSNMDLVVCRLSFSANKVNIIDIDKRCCNTSASRNWYWYHLGYFKEDKDLLNISSVI